MINKKIEGKDLAFKVLYKDEKFQLGFAKDTIDEDLDILAEVELEPNEFKFYFKKILAVVAQYNNETGKNMIKEIFEEVNIKPVKDV